MIKTTFDDRVNKKFLKACEQGKTYCGTFNHFDKKTSMDHVKT